MKTDGFQVDWSPSALKELNVAYQNNGLKLDLGLGNGKPEWAFSYQFKF